MPREAAILADLYDLEHAKTGAKNRKAYPRPWKQKGRVEKVGNAEGRSRAEVIEILRARGHRLPA